MVPAPLNVTGMARVTSILAWSVALKVNVPWNYHPAGAK